MWMPWTRNREWLWGWRIPVLLLGWNLLCAPLSAAAVPVENTRVFDGEIFSLAHATDEQGRREVFISLEELRRFAPDSRLPLLRGTDTDEDGRPDIWFFTGESGVIEAVDLPARTQDGWDAVGQILQTRLKAQKRWLLGIAFSLITDYGAAPALGAQSRRFFQSVTADQMALRELEIRVARLQRTRGISAQAATFAYTDIADGWEAMSQRFDRQIFRDRFVSALVDVGTWIGAAYVAKYAGAAVLGIAERLGATEFLDAYLSAIRSELARVRGLLPAGMRSASASMQAGRVAAGVRVQQSIAYLEAQNRAARLLATGLRTSLEFGAHAVDQRGYIATTQTMQLLSELLVRKDALVSGDPIVVRRNQVEMAQNVSFMTLETIVLAAIHARFKASPGQAMAFGAAAAFTDSNTINLLIHGVPDLSRNILDTGWEVFIGNTQTWMDVRALDFFNRMATQRGNAKLRLVGYALAILDQSSGYVAYSRVTQALASGRLAELAGKLRVEQTPILVEAAEGINFETAR